MTRLLLATSLVFTAAACVEQTLEAPPSNAVAKARYCPSEAELAKATEVAHTVVYLDDRGLGQPGTERIITEQHQWEGVDAEYDDRPSLDLTDADVMLASYGSELAVGAVDVDVVDLGDGLAHMEFIACEQTHGPGSHPTLLQASAAVVVEDGLAGTICTRVVPCE